MHNPQVKAIRIIEIFLLVSAIVLFVVGSVLGDTFFLRLATESLIFGGLPLGALPICPSYLHWIAPNSMGLHCPNATDLLRTWPRSSKLTVSGGPRCAEKASKPGPAPSLRRFSQRSGPGRSSARLTTAALASWHPATLPSAT